MTHRTIGEYILDTQIVVPIMAVILPFAVLLAVISRLCKFSITVKLEPHRNTKLLRELPKDTKEAWEAITEEWNAIPKLQTKPPDHS